MVHANLHDFIETLAEAGELRRVVAEVDPWQEIAEITDRVSKHPDGGKALLFEAVAGSPLAVATNLFGSERRLALALGVGSLDDLTANMRELLGPCSGDFSDPSAFLAAKLHPYAPYAFAGAETWEIIDEAPDLTALPALTNWDGDGGRYFTLPLVFTCDPRTGAANCGMYRVQVLDAGRAAINVGPGSGGAAHYEAYRAASAPMPAVVALGGLPETIFAATVPLPEGVDELALAGFLRREPLQVTSVCHGRLNIPITTDVVIEGEIRPADLTEEGPFGNHTGWYSPKINVPVFHAQRILRNKNAIVPATIVGPPPMEDCVFVRGWERLLLPWLQMQVPSVTALHLLLPAAFHRAAVVAAEGALDGVELVNRLRRTEPLKRSKLLVIVDPDVSPTAYEEVFWRAVNALPDGLVPAEDAPASMAIDCRSKGRAQVARSMKTVAKVTQRWQEYRLD